MLTSQPAVTKAIYQTCLLLSSLLLLLSIVSCDCQCRNTALTADQYGSLKMQVSPTNLVGDRMKTTKISIIPDPSKGPVDLTKYKIRINFTDAGGTGDVGSSIELASSGDYSR